MDWNCHHSNISSDHTYQLTFLSSKQHPLRNMPKSDDSRPLQCTTSQCDHYLIRKKVARIYIVMGVVSITWRRAENYIPWGAYLLLCTKMAAFLVIALFACANQCCHGMLTKLNLTTAHEVCCHNIFTQC